MYNDDKLIEKSSSKHTIYSHIHPVYDNKGRVGISQIVQGQRYISRRGKENDFRE